MAAENHHATVHLAKENDIYIYKKSPSESKAKSSLERCYYLLTITGRTTFDHLRTVSVVPCTEIQIQP